MNTLNHYVALFLSESIKMFIKLYRKQNSAGGNDTLLTPPSSKEMQAGT
jgi:hypothetical protein